MPEGARLQIVENDGKRLVGLVPHDDVELAEAGEDLAMEHRRMRATGHDRQIRPAPLEDCRDVMGEQEAATQCS